MCAYDCPLQQASRPGAVDGLCHLIHECQHPWLGIFVMYLTTTRHAKYLNNLKLTSEFKSELVKNIMNSNENPNLIEI